MSFVNSSFFRKYVLPGFVFQSVAIGGGYCTGRELVEYFLKFGPWAGFFGMIITTVIWSAVLAATFEFARVFRAYDYLTFFRNLLGRWWISFEIIYGIYLLIVLAVVGSAAGVLIRDSLHIPYMAGVIIMMAAVGFLTFKGTALLEKIISVWAFFLYAVYATLLGIAIVKFGSRIAETASSAESAPGFGWSAFKYAFYNLANMPGVFFCLHHIEKRKEAVWAGVLGGVTGILPAIFFYIAMMAFYPAVLSQEVPSVYIFQNMQITVVSVLFQITLFGTLLDTGAPLVHSVNERVAAAFREKGKLWPQWQRPILAVIILTITTAVSTYGLINLIAKGYGAVSWGFLFVYVIPILTVGVYKVYRRTRST
jgi:uncharacterized membrane protein YkvI